MVASHGVTRHQSLPSCNQPAVYKNSVGVFLPDLLIPWRWQLASNIGITYVVGQVILLYTLITVQRR